MLINEQYKQSKQNKNDDETQKKKTLEMIKKMKQTIKQYDDYINLDETDYFIRYQQLRIKTPEQQIEKKRDQAVKFVSVLEKELNESRSWWSYLGF